MIQLQLFINVVTLYQKQWSCEPHLCDTLMISMKFYTNRVFVGVKVFYRELTQATALGHVVVPRLSPLPQFLREVVKKVAGEDRSVTS